MDCFVSPYGLPRKDGKRASLLHILANVRKDGKGKVALQKTMELCGIAPESSLREALASWQSTSLVIARLDEVKAWQSIKRILESSY